MLKQLGVKVSGYPGGLVPLDVDVFPQDNSNTRKEGVSRTCKNFDGYAPIAASLGMEGWCLESELRPGSQHGQAGFVVFIQQVFKAAQVLIEQEILVYLAGRLISTGRRLCCASVGIVRCLQPSRGCTSNLRRLVEPSHRPKTDQQQEKHAR
jgi:hypothetical protein